MNELKHHGILGMKWGIRRYQNPDGSLTAAGRKRRGLSGTVKAKPKQESYRQTNDPKQMSNEELQARIQRIQLENQYKQLTAREASTGEKFVKEVVGTSLKTVATKRLTKFLNDRLDSYISKKTGEKNLLANQNASADAYAKETADWDRKRRNQAAGEYAYKFANMAANAAASGFASSMARAAAGYSTQSAGSDFVQSVFNTPITPLLPGR